MAWRVLQNGAMVEVVHGVQTLRNGATIEKTSTVIAREGRVFKEELSKDMVARYDANDERVRALVERVEITKDKAGNEVITAAGAPAREFTGSESEAAEAVAAAEKVAEELVAKVSELEAAHAEAVAENEKLSGELKEAEEVAAEALSYGDLSPEALKAEAEKKGIEVKRSDGKDGEPVKADYVKALEEARSST